MAEHTTFNLIDVAEDPVKIAGIMPDKREFEIAISGPITRKEARVILGAIMNIMRAGLRADNFRHGSADQLAPALPPQERGSV